MKVMKFGGSSVASPERIRDVVRIVLASAKRERSVVVVSAFQGVTNQLLESARLAERNDPGAMAAFERISKRHREAIDTLLGASKDESIRENAAFLVDRLLEEYREILTGITLLRHCPSRALDLIGSFGERLSSVIVSAYVNTFSASMPVDTRELIVTDDQYTRAAVQFEFANPRIKNYFKKLPKGIIPVVTGFIGSTQDGHTTTIGRNGSDYTAAIIGAALDASVIEIWTDVDGIMSADPHAVPAAFVLPEMTFEEAMELSYFGAKVLHSATIAPAVAKNIPILIKNTMNPTAPGTMIARTAAAWEHVAKGITAVEDMTLLTLRGMSMVGVPGTAERLFRALGGASVNVILISQASSEHTICFAISEADSARARQAITTEFRYEFGNGLASVDEKPQQAIIAVVGDGMRGTPGVSGKLFQALGYSGVNINAIAQGASERNISFVVDGDQRGRAINVIHQAFFEKRKRLSLVFIGVGNIGDTLLRQLDGQRKHLLQKGFDVQVVVVANSKRFAARQEGFTADNWLAALEQSKEVMNPTAIIETIAKFQLTNVAVVDCTASADVVGAYPEFVRANMHIITPNKKANVLPWKQYDEFMKLLGAKQKFFLYEANVGAGLPVISTLSDLITSGDTVKKIEGILSGTLSYLFNSYDGTKPFSAVVRHAQELGYTEPDPREDLSGEDVARKLLILGRQLGLKMDLRDIAVESLVPRPLRSGAFTPGFFEKLASIDSAMEKQYRDAAKRNAVLRFTGVLSGGRGEAGLKEYPKSHPFAQMEGTDNIIAFTTARYAKTPLIIRGPGAGADVTAMGVFSDILKLLHYLPF